MDYALDIALAILPHAWQVVLGFLVGCWWYRRMLKNNPAKLEALVDLTNKTTETAEKAVRNVAGSKD